MCDSHRQHINKLINTDRTKRMRKLLKVEDREQRFDRTG